MQENSSVYQASFNHLKLLKLKLKYYSHFWLQILTAILSSSFGMANLVSAQIVPDNTLTTDSEIEVIQQGEKTEVRIIKGTRVGDNLFHSFEQFSVLKDHIAAFQNDLDVNNIFTRVTGGSISEINGVIKALGSANLFLINPNGITFGKDASLNIGGSFFATTAERIKFSDGSFYSAINPEVNSLLTVSVPLGLQYGSNSGNIIVQGVGNNLSFDSSGTFIQKDNRPVGLQVNSGNTLALIGGKVKLQGGNLTAKQGRVEIGSVADTGLVTLIAKDTGFIPNYEQIIEFDDISLAKASSIEVSGNGAGKVNIQGKNVSLTDGSGIMADLYPDVPGGEDKSGGEIKITGSESVTIDGMAESNFFVTLLSSDVFSQGDAGIIQINTDKFSLSRGAQILSVAFSQGDAATVDIKAKEIEISDEIGAPVPTGIFAPVVPFATGEGGDVKIKTDSLVMKNGSQIFVATLGDGDAGQVEIKAKTVEFIGTAFEMFPSGIIASVQKAGDFPALGKGGDVKIVTDILRLINGGQINLSTSNTGNAGNLMIEAKDIEITGASDLNVSSGLFANVNVTASGKGGQINIQTNSLTVDQGGNIVSITRGKGDAGDIEITAKSAILLSGTTLDGETPSTIAVSTTNGTGNAGILNITTDSLKVLNGAQIASTTRTIGKGGLVNIKAQNIELIGFSELGRSGIFSNSFISSGDSGNIDIVTDTLNIKEGATITASNFQSRDTTITPGTGKAGEIKIVADSIKLESSLRDEPSTITAATNTNKGGDINLAVAKFVQLDGNSQITAETQNTGNGGKITLNTTTLALTNGGLISTNSFGAGDAGDIEVNLINQNNFSLENTALSETFSIPNSNFNQSLILFNQAQISTNSEDFGQAGNITINGKQFKADQGSITATSINTGGGNIKLNLTSDEDAILLENNSLISTSVLDSTGGGGNITIDSRAGFILANNNSDIRANAVFGQGGKIQIITKGIFLNNESEIDASSQFGEDGTIEIIFDPNVQNLGVIQLPSIPVDVNKLIATGCPLDEQNTFVITGRNGLPQNPTQLLRNNNLWEDTRNLAIINHNEAGLAAKLPKNNQIIEAKNWVRNNQGTVELVAANQTQSNNFLTNPNCKEQIKL